VQPHHRVLERVEVAGPREPAVLQDPHLVRHTLEIRHDVRREQHRARRVGRAVDELGDEAAACDRVEASHRLVEHEQVGTVAER
jgi:hypothetical protein